MRIRSDLLVSLFVVACLTIFRFVGHAASLDEVSLRLATNAVIDWQAPLDRFPEELWTYKRISPRIFPNAVISNAMVIASLQNNEIPKSSAKDFCLDLDKRPTGHPCTFSIYPRLGSLNYSKPNFDHDSTGDIPTDENIIKRAWECAAKLGLDQKQLKQVEPLDHFCSYNESGQPLSNWDGNAKRITIGPPCGRTVFLARVIDGIRFIGDGEDGWPTEGFTLQIGSHDRLRSFSLVWPELARDQKQSPATSQQMMDCIRTGKMVVLPENDETAYLQRVRSLSSSTKLTVTNARLYYFEGRYGEEADQEPSQWVTPFAILSATAKINGTNANLQFLCPVIATEISKLEKPK